MYQHDVLQTVQGTVQLYRMCYAPAHIHYCIVLFICTGCGMYQHDMLITVLYCIYKGCGIYRYCTVHMYRMWYVPALCVVHCIVIFICTGCGMYQHDVSQTKLNTALDEIVVECVRCQKMKKD